MVFSSTGNIYVMIRIVGINYLVWVKFSFLFLQRSERGRPRECVWR